MKLVVLLAAAVAATPVEKEQAAPLVQATRDSKTAEVAEAGADREGKLFSVFEIVRFNNDACTGDDGKEGVCYTAAQCTEKKGMATGNCAMGFGVCCRILVDPNCPIDVTTASATLVNPGFPGTFSDASATSCGSSSASTRAAAPRIFFPTIGTDDTSSTTLMSGIDSSENTTAGITYRWAIYKSSATVEQIRIDMKEFDIAGPKGGACTNESMTIMGADAVTHKILPDMLCGVLTGQHVYLSVKDLGTGDKDFITIEIALTSQGMQKWELLITQIEGDATDDLAPRGCLQYFKEEAGTFSTFNWDSGNGNVINGNQYSICIKDNDAYCDVALTANMDFELKQDSTTSTCNDKVAFGTNVYCGTTFDGDNMATWNYTGAYQIPVFISGDPMVELNTPAVGFEISYVLLPC